MRPIFATADQIYATYCDRKYATDFLSSFVGARKSRHNSRKCRPPRAFSSGWAFSGYASKWRGYIAARSEKPRSWTKFDHFRY